MASWPTLRREANRLSGTILIYGATGYTGKLIAKEAAAWGAHPILAGRGLEKVQAVAKPTNRDGSRVCSRRWRRQL